jgi:hypothetical protein
MFIQEYKGKIYLNNKKDEFAFGEMASGLMIMC